MLSYLINLSYTALDQSFSKHLTAKTLSISTLAKHKITLPVFSWPGENDCEESTKFGLFVYTEKTHVRDTDSLNRCI